MDISMWMSIEMSIEISIGCPWTPYGDVHLSAQEAGAVGWVQPTLCWAEISNLVPAYLFTVQIRCML